MRRQCCLDQDKDEPKEQDDTEETEEPGTKEAWKNPDEKRLITVTVPTLMFIGRLKFSFDLNNRNLSEKTVMPLVVLGAFIAYFGIAAIFYFD